MKKITYYIMLLFVFQLQAQTIYQSTDFAQVGEAYLVSNSSTGIQTFDFEQTGVNYTWDYSTLPVSTQEGISYEDPNNSGYKTTWCLSNGYVFNCNTEFNNTFNLAIQLSEGIQIQDYGITNMVAHSYASTTFLENRMLGGSIAIEGISIPVTVDYTDPDVVYEFPITYNDTYTNVGNLEIDLNDLGVPISYSSEIERTNDVEGWGSVITPYQTYTDVLKMKTTIVQNDTIVTQAETIPTTRTTVSYKWFDPNYGMPVLEVAGEEISGVFVPTMISYIDEEQCLEPMALFSYIPIAPEYDYNTSSTNVNFFNLSTNFDSVLWDFGDGTTSTDTNPSHIYTCPGIHQVTLTVTNEFCEPDIQASITFPINIIDPDDLYTNEITLDDTSLSAEGDTEGTTYQWVDCDNNFAFIAGETNQTFIPTDSGNYAVILTTNGCQSMSNCYMFDALSILEVDLEENVSLYPNPTNGILYLNSSYNIDINKIEIYDATGKLVGNSLDLSKNKAGIYFVKIETHTNQTSIKKIVKF